MSKTDERVSSQIMELKDLIAGPLVATIDADSLSIQRYLDYLFQIAFETYDSSTGEAKKLRMLRFNYLSHSLQGSIEQTLSIPLLTLIPLPLLQIQEADFDFDIQILDSSSKRRRSVFSFDGKGQTGQDELQNDTRLRVALAASSGGTSNSEESRSNRTNANMKVHVKMRQSDIPGGLATLLGKAVNNMIGDISTGSETATGTK